LKTRASTNTSTNPKTKAKMVRTRESVEARKTRAKGIVRGLKRLYPDADCALTHENPLELLIATILSAQSTDVTVNKVTPVLFDRYPSVEDIAGADLDELEDVVRTTGFFRQKAKNIQNACRMIVERYGGEVPETMEELVELPGVARKTANVVLGTAFGLNEGVVVDTHVGRLATRMCLTWRSKDTKDAVKIERDLMEIVPRKQWTYLSHALILHGREICGARKPNCDGCKLATFCPSAGVV
jgi:endonuclease III